MTLGKGLLQSLQHTFNRHDRFHFEQRTKHNHIESLVVFQLKCSLHGVDVICGDIGALGRSVNSVAVVDKYATGFHLALKAVEALLIEHHGDVVGVEDRRADALVTENYSDVGCAATLLGTVRWHPGHFFVFHKSGIGKNLAHREDTLSSETGYNDFCFHAVKKYG